MKKVLTDEEKYRRMTEEPVHKLTLTLAIPTIINMLITAIYNMADSFFVGKIGTSATAAIGIAFSVMAIIQAIGFTFGMGAGNFISRLLGKKEKEYASKVAATSFITAILVGIILAILGIIFLEPLVYLLGATETIAPYAKNYVRIILIGMPYMTGAFVLNNILRYQGSAFLAMLGISTGGILNLILDPLFIFVFKLGVSGAAIATIISQFVSFGILLYNSGRRGTIKIQFKNFTPTWAIYKEILSGGLPSFYRQGLASVATIVLNSSAAVFGDAAIAAMSIVTRIFQFALSALIGFGQGFQPVCGFNYGAKYYDRVTDAFWFCIKGGAVVLCILSGIIFSFAPQIVSLFRKDDLEVIAIGARALRLQSLTFPLSSWIIICNMLLQTIGKGTKASILSMARQGLFFLPTLLILSHTIGLIGIQISQPIADIMTFIIAVPMGLSVLKELNKDSNMQYSKA